MITDKLLGKVPSNVINILCWKRPYCCYLWS